VIYLMLYHLYPGDPPPADEVARGSPIAGRVADVPQESPEGNWLAGL
jgi:hypothetical protein